MDPNAAPFLASGDVKKTTSRALEVFLEGVDTDVCDHVPRQRPFADVLSQQAAMHVDLLRAADLERRDRVLSLVADSSVGGDSTMETEQCREQEQEKEQEQEQEQELEMERYVDLAFGRDNEEPRPWPFRELSSATKLFDDKFFYPMSDFRLHGDGHATPRLCPASLASIVA